MAKTTTNDQLFINDGRGVALPIATGVFQTKAIDMSERRRLSVTADFTGGFTGTLVVEGTDEIGNCSISGDSILRPTGASIAWAGAGSQPGSNGMSGAKYWTPVPSGTVGITNSTTFIQFQMNEVNTRWIRLNFNKGITSAIGSAVGTGAIALFITAKST